MKNEDIFSVIRKFEGGLFSEPEAPSDIKPYNPIDGRIIFDSSVEVNLPNNTAIDAKFEYEIGMWKTSNEQLLIPEDKNSAFNIGLKNNTMRITISYLFDLSPDD